MKQGVPSQYNWTSALHGSLYSTGPAFWAEFNIWKVLLLLLLLLLLNQTDPGGTGL